MRGSERGSRSDSVGEQLGLRNVAGPTLLGGARTAEEWARLGEMLSALHYVSIEDSQWVAAAELGFHARRSGLTVPFTDLLIGAVAISVDAILVHRDRHFDLLATQSALKVESHVQAG